MPSGKPEEHQGRILIVEDQANWQQVYLDVLRPEPYDVVIASSADRAVIELDQSRFDVVILDLRLIDDYIFGYQGLDLIDYAKAKGARTLVCTGFGSPELRNVVLSEFRADAYLQKDPGFDIIGFRRELHSLLAARLPRSGNA